MLKMMMMQRVRGLVKNEQGAVAIEYVLLAGLVAVVIIVGATALGTNLNDFLQAVADKVGLLKPVP